MPPVAHEGVVVGRLERLVCSIVKVGCQSSENDEIRVERVHERAGPAAERARDVFDRSRLCGGGRAGGFDDARRVRTWISRRPPAERAGESTAVHLEIPAPGGTTGTPEVQASERHVTELAAFASGADERLPVDHDDAADTDLDREIEDETLHPPPPHGVPRQGPRASRRCRRRTGAREGRRARGRGGRPRASAAWRPAGAGFPRPFPRSTPRSRGHAGRVRRAARPEPRRISARVASGARARRPSCARTMRPPNSTAATRQPPCAISIAHTTGPSGCGSRRPEGRPRCRDCSGACSTSSSRVRSRAVISVVELLLIRRMRATSDRETPGRSWTRRRTASAPAAR